MRKYEFTGETKLHFGITLRRIRAAITITFPTGFQIKAGELGGWIEKESNLEHDGNAWVSGNARVYGNAWVYGDAEVSKQNHLVQIGAIGSRDAVTTFFRTKTHEIKVACGCFYGTVSEFLAKVEATHGDNKHGRVYRLAAELAIAQIDLSPVDENNE